MLRVISFIALIFLTFGTSAQTLVINEVSQGLAGSEEFVELLVIPSPSQTIYCTQALPCLDLRGWIFDDNNGYFSGGPQAGVGIASGSCRFSLDPFWSCVPVGTIITIYNDAELSGPGNDLSLGDGDCDLVIPISSTLFDKSNSPQLPNTSNANYPTSWLSGGSWTQISLANDDDSFQIYDPSDLSAPVHAVSWGTAGGANNQNTIIYFAQGTGGDVMQANNSVDCDFSNQGNWSVLQDQVSLTMGTFNTVANQSCIEAINNSCLNPMIASAISTNEECLCDGTVSAEDALLGTPLTVGSDGNYTYAWYDDSDPFVSLNETTATVTGLCPGTYNVIVTSGTGCIDTATVTVAPSVNPLPIITGALSTCVNGGINLTGSGTPATSPAWLITGGTGTATLTNEGTNIVTVNGTVSGTVILEYTNISGCVATETVIFNPLPLATVSGGGSYCTGTAPTGVDVTIALTGTGPWDFTYTDGVTPVSVTDFASSTYTISDATAGTYTVTAINDANCVGTFLGSALITETPLPTATVSGGGSYCLGTAPTGVDVTITLTGTGPWDFTYTDGVTPVVVTGFASSTYPIPDAPAGTYTLTAVNNANCVGTISGSAAVIAIPLPVITLTPQDPSSCGGTDGYITVNGIGTGGVYWSGTATSFASGQTLNYVIPTLAGGAYDVYFIDGTTSCQSLTVSTALSDPTSPVFTAVLNANPSTCGANDGSVLIEGTGTLTPGGNYNLVYSINGLPTSSASITTDLNGNYLITPLSAGAYTNFTLTLGICSGTQNGPITLVDPTTPAVTVNNPSAVCTPATVDITTAGSTDVGTISYFDTDGTTPLATPGAITTSGTYYISADNAGCITAEPVLVTVNTAPTATVSGGGSYCAGTTPTGVDVTITLTGTGTWNFTYTDGVTPVSVTGFASSTYPIPDATAGTYTVTAINNANCVGTISGSAAVIAIPLPVITLSPQDPSSCGGTDGYITVNGIGTGDIYWSGTATSFASGQTLNYVIPTLAGGAYDVYFIDGTTSCQSLTVSTALSDPTSPVFTAVLNANPSTCGANDGSVLIEGTGTLTPGGNYNLVYSVNGFPTTSTSITTDVNGDYLISPLTAGTYTNFILTLGICSGTQTGPITLVDPTTPTVTVTDPTPVCAPATVDITTAGSTDVGTISYFDTDGTTPLATPGAITTSGTYYISADNAGCITAEPIVVSVFTTPTIDPLGPITSCDNYILPAITGAGINAPSYWTGPNQTGNQLNIGSTYSVTGLTTIYMYDGTSGCFDEEPVSVTIDPLPSVTGINGGATYCAGDLVSDILVDLTGAADWTINYTLNGTAQTAVVGSTSPVSLGNTAGIYVLTDMSDANCTNTVSGTQTITINPIPSAPTAGMDTTYCTSWTYLAMTASGSNGTYTWYSDAGLSSVLATGGSLLPTDVLGSTTYYVTETLLGCEGPSSAVVITIEDCEIIVPTAFTPDGDLANDVWQILDLDDVYTENVVMVFNRWGAKLYESVKGNYLSKPWDGTFKEDALPVGSYYFIIDFNLEDVEPMKGIVSIILE